MKLVVIYGPPAAGKHTTAKKLTELTGYKFFYNHLTVDVVRALFDDKDERREKLLAKLRVDTIAEAAHYGLDTVFTMAYNDTEYSRNFVHDMEAAVNKYGGTIHYVLLNPPDGTLFERIGNQSRVKLRKPTSAENLRELLATRNFRVNLDAATLVLDTSKLVPEQSARRIIDEFGLL